MRMRREIGYFLGLVPGLLAIVGNLAGGYWTIGTAGLLAVLWIYDWLCPHDDRPPAPSSGLIPDLALLAHVIVMTFAVGTLLHGVANFTLRGNFMWLAAASTGINSGMSGITVAHELIHRRNRLWRWAGLWNLLLVNYVHWAIAHVRIHHRYVGTERDPATARYGESVYHFVPRSVGQNFILALRNEAERLRRLGRPAYGPANFVICVVALELAIAVAIGMLIGPFVLLAYLLQSAVAIYSLEVVNYIEHYGLSRAPGERVTPAHSWHTDTICNRFMLLELNRHADHHTRAAQPYHKLRTYPESPLLPAGYWGATFLSAFPSLWFRVMNPLIDRLQNEEDSEAAARGAGGTAR